MPVSLWSKSGLGSTFLRVLSAYKREIVPIISWPSAGFLPSIETDGVKMAKISGR